MGEELELALSLSNELEEVKCREDCEVWLSVAVTGIEPLSVMPFSPVFRCTINPRFAAGRPGIGGTDTGDGESTRARGDTVCIVWRREGSTASELLVARREKRRDKVVGGPGLVTGDDS